MKKVLIIVLLLACLLGLVGCDPGSTRMNGEDLLNNTTKIELVDYENKRPKTIIIGGKQTSVFNFNKTTFLAALDESRFEDAINDIAKQDLLVFGRTMNEPIGKTLILYQNDGTMVVLFSCVYKTPFSGNRYYGMCNIYDENGKFVKYLGDIGSDYVDTLEAAYFQY